MVVRAVDGASVAVGGDAADGVETSAAMVLLLVVEAAEKAGCKSVIQRN